MLNLGLTYGVINEKVFTVMVIMALFTTFMTVPVISYVYPTKLYMKKKSKCTRLKSPSGVSLTNPSSAPLIGGSDPLDSDVKLMLCLPNLQTLPSMMAITQMIQSTPVEMSLHALRLIPLGERDSTVMMASDSENTIRADPALNVFKTFGDLNRVGVSPMLNVCRFEDFAENIVGAADEINANLIILPWNPHTGTSEPLEEHHKGFVQRYDQSQRKLLVDAVCENSSCTIVVFIDRGFSIGTHVSYNHELTTQSTRSALIAAAEEDPQQIYVFFAGGADDREALLFSLYLTHFKGAQVHLIIVQKNNETTMAGLSRSDSAIIGLNKSDSVQTLNVNSTLNKEDEQLLSTVVKQCPTVKVQEHIVVQPLDFMAEFINEKHLQKIDLVIVGKSRYESGLRNFVDSECKSSVCVVQCSKMDKSTSA